MATPNYGFEKRQRELAKKKKKEEKLRAKAAGKRHDDPEGGDGQDVQDQAGDAPAPSEGAGAAD